MFNPVIMVLVGVLLLAGYLAIAQSVCQNAVSKRMIPALAIVTLFIYLCGVGFIGLLYVYFGYDVMVLFAAMLIFAAAALVLVVRACVKHSRHMNWLYVVLFAAYCALVAYVTLYIRVGTFTKAIQMVPFDRVSKAIERGDAALMSHDVLNMLMFVPLGVLIPLMNRRVFNKISYAFLFGLIASTAIETTQLLTHLGTFDIDDIIANVLGAVVGYAVCSLILRFTGKREEWR